MEAEKIIELLIAEGKISREELDAMIAIERNQSPLLPLQEDSAFLLYDSMAKDVRIAEVEQMSAELMYAMMMGGN